MIIATLAWLGVPLWLLLGWLAGALWHRQELKKLPGLFQAKVRLVSGNYRDMADDFPFLPSQAVWAHDILMIERGLMLARNFHFPVADGVQPPEPADPKKIKRLGDSPVTLLFRLDNDAIIEVAVAGEDETFARGPFFTDTIEDGPGA